MRTLTGSHHPWVRSEPACSRLRTNRTSLPLDLRSRFAVVELLHVFIGLRPQLTAASLSEEYELISGRHHFEPELPLVGRRSVTHLPLGIIAWSPGLRRTHLRITPEA